MLTSRVPGEVYPGQGTPRLGTRAGYPTCLGLATSTCLGTEIDLVSVLDLDSVNLILVIWDFNACETVSVIYVIGLVLRPSRRRGRVPVRTEPSQT